MQPLYLYCRGFAEWMFIIGVYGVTRELVTKPYPWLPPLSQLAMPFYLSHQQILIMIAAGASWYPHLSKDEIPNCTDMFIICGFRVLSCCPYSVYDWNPAGVLGDHQGGTHQIFVWSPHQRIFSLTWESYGRLPSPDSDECPVRCCLRSCPCSVKWR